jgi:sugar/nucleoside kinase (ribokinase family)
MRAPLTALVVGSLSRDRFADGSVVPGGVVHWAGLALLRMGAQVRVLTRAAERDDGLLDELRAAGARVIRLASAETTECRNRYGPGADRHELWACSDPIRASDVPAGWRSADVIQLGPLHPRDLAPGIARELRGRVGLDVQGLVRAGRGAATHLAPAEIEPFAAPGVHVLKASEGELPFVLRAGETPEALLARAGVEELLVTRGARGSTLFARAGRFELPALPVAPRHPTGAGDVFLAAFLCARALGWPAPDAARLASRASAAKIEAGMLPADFRLEEGA